MRARRIAFLALAASAAALSACQSADDATQARGPGESRTYVASFEAVFAALPAIVDEVGLAVVEEDRDEGVILASHGPSPFSFGENVAIHVEERAGTLTEVEVVSQPLLPTNAFANDWSDEIFAELGRRFRGYIALEGPARPQP